MLLVEEVLNRNGKNILNKIKVGDRFFTPVNEIGSYFLEFSTQEILSKENN